MADYVDDPARRLSDLLDRMDRRIANVFRTAIVSLKDEIDLTALADLLAQGRVNEAIERLNHAAESLGAAVNVAFVTSGQSTADFLNAANVGRVVFDQVNHRAVAAMQASTLSLIREFTAEQLRATSLALVSGVEGGINPIAQARNFRDSIGLTERQWTHVASYRETLNKVGRDGGAAAAVSRALRDKRGDAQILRAVRENRPLAPEKIDWMVERYTARYVKHRAEVIGRTEALRAVHKGNEEMYQQAIDAGTLDPTKLRRKWVTHLDGHERKTHEILNGQIKGWGEPWITVNGIIRFPGDEEAAAAETIQCRCAIATRIMQR